MPSERTRRGFLALTGAATVGLSGCVFGSTERDTPTPSSTPEPDRLESWARYDPDWQSPTDSPLAPVETTTVVKNLKVPWDFAFGPNGDLFVSERVGRVLKIENGSKKVIAEPPEAVDAGAITAGEEGGWWATGGEDGLLGVAVHPEYPDEPYVYAYYTYKTDETESGQLNNVVRYDVSADDVTATEETVVDGIASDQYHNGGRIAFGPLGNLWITCGDGGQPKKAQDTGFLGGKVLRVTPEGDPPEDNPTDVEDRRVYTYGHRNPQCITWLPDGTPVTAEHGPSAKDEVNVLQKGDNYGWPEARTREQYTGSDFHHPVVNTGGETWAPSGGVFYTGDAVPAWRNRLLLGCLRGQHVNLVTLAQEGRQRPPTDAEGARAFTSGWFDTRFTATSHKDFVDELGRVRYVGQGPDGNVYAITSNRDGRAEGDRFPRPKDDVMVRFEPTG